MRTFFTLYYLLISSDVIAALIGVISIWSMRHDDILVRRLTLLFECFIAGRVFEYIGSTYSPAHYSDLNTSFIFWSLAGKTIISISIWALVIMIVKVRSERKNGNH